MNIKELSDLTHINVETIRAYRKKGLLHPTQNPNNRYYEYSEEDFLNLLYIRKLRSYSLSLDAITKTYYENNTDIIIDVYRKQLTVMQEQLRLLQSCVQGLTVALDHLEEYRENDDGIQEIDAYDEKIDSYFEDAFGTEAFDRWIRNIGMFTYTIGITSELLSDPLPEQIPVRMGLGAYRSFLEENGLPIPEKAVSCPKGRYVTSRLYLDDRKWVSREQLLPMLNYIKEKHYRIDSDATAFLFRIDYSGETPQYLFRLRVKVLPT